MAIRITPHRQNELGLTNSQAQYARSAILSQQISSGKRVNKPSDDPIAQKLILNQTVIQQRFENQLTAISSTRVLLSNAHTQVLGAQQLLVQAKEIAMQARQSTEPTERDIFTQQLEGILKQLDTIANSQSDGRYLFAGTQTTTRPFSNVASGTPTYQGSTATANVSLIGHPDIPLFYNGSEVFQPATAGRLAISGSTGIASGAGTSTGSATSTLVIRHTQTTYSGTSGIQAGTQSPGGDSILGPSGTHTLTIVDTSGTGASGTISLNGGPPVNFSSSDTNLLISGPDGEQVYLNTQSITAGFNGTIDLTATGTLSLNNGATLVPIDFSNDQILIDSTTGSTLHFDTTNLTRTGTVTAEPETTADIFAAVRILRDTILNVGNLSPDEQQAAFDRSLGNLDAASDHILKVIGQQSVDLKHLDDLQSRIGTLKLNSEILQGSAEGTDYATAITQLQEQQTLLQFTLQTISTMNSISILDFL